MEKKVNILGDSPKEAWKNAIGLYALVIESRLDDAAYGAKSAAVKDDVAAALKAFGNFKDEMLRLVDAAFDE